uniref:Phosphatidylinositol-4,5-bisphosphate 4-phosphatase n=1 Tax=Strongyloides stercoralis TaxID=6248 RepID=A0A0K0EF08_STRER
MSDGSGNNDENAPLINNDGNSDNRRLISGYTTEEVVSPNNEAPSESSTSRGRGYTNEAISINEDVVEGREENLVTNVINEEIVPDNVISYGSTDRDRARMPTSESGSEAQSDGFQRPPFVECRVCQREVDISARLHQHVVRCGVCGEATPIRSAPPGKKYVRCPCNCLLICKASSARIACPRRNCRRVITLGDSTPTGIASRAPPGTSRISCVWCHEVFMFNTLVNRVAQCPHCKKESSVGAGFARSRAIFFTSLAILVFIITVIVNCLTWSPTGHVFLLLIIYLTGYISSISLAYKSLYFWRLKVSNSLGPL